MKKNLLNKYQGESRPTVTTNSGKTFEVWNTARGYQIIRLDSYSWKIAQTADTNGKIAWFSPTAPRFTSKIHAVRYMMDNAEMLA